MAAQPPASHRPEVRRGLALGPVGVTGEPRPDAYALGQAPDEMQGIWAWPAASEVTQQRQLNSPTLSPSVSQVCFTGGRGSWLISIVK